MGIIRSTSCAEMLLCLGTKVCFSPLVNYCIVSLFSKRYSLLPALSMDGIIWAKIVEGSFTKPLSKNLLLNS